MIKTSLLCIGLVGVTISSFAQAEPEDSVVVFEKKSGLVSEHSFTRMGYSEKMERLMSSVNSNVLPTLDSREDRGAWKLRAVLVGLGINFDAGLGPVLEFRAKSRLQMIYTRNGEPYTP